MITTSKCMSFTSNSTGGEYRHSLSEVEMPQHAHYEYIMVKGYEGWPDVDVDQYGIMIDFASSNYVAPNQKVKATFTNGFVVTGHAGENVPHNNIQPYIVTYFWRRTK